MNSVCPQDRQRRPFRAPTALRSACRRNRIPLMNGP